MASNLIARRILDYLHYAYPIALLLFFLLAFTAQSIKISNRNANDAPQNCKTGPGGKPLPERSPNRPQRNDLEDPVSSKQKLVFEWLSAAAAVTFIANCATVIIHALYSRDEGWWCGQPVVVSLPVPQLPSSY